MKARSSVKRCVGICFVVAQLAYLSTYWYSTWLNARVPCSTASECPGDGGESPRLAKPPVFNSKEHAGPRYLTFARIGEYGRLGNQLFQVASTVGIAEKNGLTWKLPVAVESASIGRLFRLTGSELMIDELDQYKEQNGTFYEVQLDGFTKGVSLHGYFQSRKYFASSTDTLRTIFSIPQTFVERVLNEVPQVIGNSVTLHVRRGDYVQLSHLYILLGKGYYRDALEKLDDVDVVVIVSDDIEWCKANLSLELRVDVVYSPFKDEILDFVLLFLGKHSIIANSSFSWWSAYLKTLLKPKVDQGQTFAPRPWYNPSGSLRHLNTDDLYLESWQVIDA